MDKLQTPSSSLSAPETVDVIVLGVGTSGEDLSLCLLDSGLSVIGIEAALVGGECPYWACLPTKMVVRASQVLQEARRINGMAGLFGDRSQPEFGQKPAAIGTTRSLSSGLRAGVVS